MQHVALQTWVPIYKISYESYDNAKVMINLQQMSNLQSALRWVQGFS